MAELTLRPASGTTLPVIEPVAGTTPTPTPVDVTPVTQPGEVLLATARGETQLRSALPPRPELPVPQSGDIGPQVAARITSTAETFITRRAQLDADIARGTPGDELGDAQAALQAERAALDASRPEVVGRIRESARTAIERLETLRRVSTEQPSIDGQIERVRQSERRALAGVYLAAGDDQAAERAILPAALTTAGPLLTSTRLAPTVAAIERMPAAERTRAANALLELADLHVRADNMTSVARARRMVSAIAARTGDTPLALRCDLLAAQEATRASNFGEARRVLEATYTRASALPDRRDAEQLKLQTVVGQVAVLRSEATLEGTDGDQAADRLRGLRMRLEREGPLSRDQLARLTLLEAQTFLTRQRSGDARDSLRTLGRYEDLPWAARAGDEFRRNNSEAGITAAIKVGLRSAGSPSTGVALGGTLGAGVAGAAVGFAVAGPPGAGAGFLIGSAVGSAGVAAYGVYRQWDDVTQAFDTGLTQLTWRDAATDGALLGLNVVGSAAPIAGYARLGAQGITRTGLVESLRTSTTRLGIQATTAEIEREARVILARELVAGSAQFGGRVLPAAGATALVGPLAAEYARIEGMESGPDRDAARSRFMDNLGTGLAMSAVSLATNGVALRASTRGGRGWPIKGPVVAVADTPMVAAVVEKRPLSFAELERRAVSFDDIADVPGRPDAVPAGAARRFLLTADIRPGDLPYETGIRPPSQRRPVPASLADVPIAPVSQISDIVLASAEHSGAQGFVRLAQLSDGRPVVVKTYSMDWPTGDSHEVRTLREARALQLGDDLGIGPRFHGLVRDGDRMGMVMDFVPGDSVGTPVTPRTFADVETMIQRLRDNGLTEISDFQVNRDAQGGLLMIDVGALDGLGGRSPPNSADGVYTDIRRAQLLQAKEATGATYLWNLLREEPEAYEGLAARIRSDRDARLKRFVPFVGPDT